MLTAMGRLTLSTNLLQIFLRLEIRLMLGGGRLKWVKTNSKTCYGLSTVLTLSFRSVTV